MIRRHKMKVTIAYNNGDIAKELEVKELAAINFTGHIRHIQATDDLVLVSATKMTACNQEEHGTTFLHFQSF